MRYEPEHKAKVHQKIVKDAAGRFRAKGLATGGVSAVMQDVGLTHGGFYKHFDSKDDLLIEALSEAFRETSDRLSHVGDAKPGSAWKAIVKAYLSPEHCDHAKYGCPLAALAPELARTDKAMKARILRELENYKNRMLPFMPGRRLADRHHAFFAIFSTMIGAVEMARMMPTPAMRDEVLSSARNLLFRSF